MGYQQSYSISDLAKIMDMNWLIEYMPDDLEERFDVSIEVIQEVITGKISDPTTHLSKKWDQDIPFKFMK
ncbi:hypothetical protein ACFPYN_13980 [Paenisporosarcina macmurdoensis]|uniref:Uncharacterized protein n=1 Tax=Paenisporosarcina macmurdoensis TaxID=212659 RepID=A0ABW1L998_9BACL